LQVSRSVKAAPAAMNASKPTLHTYDQKDKYCSAKGIEPGYPGYPYQRVTDPWTSSSPS
jgi:hypothetical protein